jgi:hypothetical protein
MRLMCPHVATQPRKNAQFFTVLTELAKLEAAMIYPLQYN